MNTRIFIRKIFSNAQGLIGSLIIGVSIIIGLNFQWFTSNISDIISGESRRQEEMAIIDNEREIREYSEVSEYKKLWEIFLTNNFNGKQFRVIKRNSGDYLCFDPLNSYPKQEINIFTGQVKNEWPKSIQEIKDETADKFLIHLNENKFLKKINWAYDDIDNYVYSHIFKVSDQYPCQTIKDGYRRNRYKQRIDLEIKN
jgi:hypothetical protein